MPKRKREPRSKNAAPPTLTTRILGVVKQSQAVMVDALQYAQRFERQKLSRRWNTAKEAQNDADVQRITQEIQALKTLDIPAMADRHIRRVFSRVKAIAASDDIPSSYRPRKEDPLDSANTNVVARLYKVKGVAEEMARLVESVKELLQQNAKNPEEGNATKPLAKKPIPSSKEPETTVLEQSPNKPASNTSQTIEKEVTGDKLSPAVDDEKKSKIKDVPRTASDIGQDEERNTSYSSASLSPDMDELTLSESEPESRLVIKLSNKKSSRSKAPEITNNSTFLPSLTAVGYISGSESEASDINDDLAPRKNRRGQRARQAIWEKKYKDKAKHLQEDQTTKKKSSSRDQGWDSQRGAVEQNASNGDFRQNRASRNSEAQSGEAVTTSRKRIKDDAGPLHPSWAAKKQMKAKESIPLAQFAGKKIVFD
ncbi:Bud-site selection protein [Microthyrium microscopicum]|uniref:Bud-site selection protein n=1 Tax=Microthyrium microscopicum TaxID=703497 RepID=A0A6A6UEU1_9PEZI|nr:Bud-site selection protein [Microthyrium microscopicum]